MVSKSLAEKDAMEGGGDCLGAKSHKYRRENGEEKVLWDF